MKRTRLLLVLLMVLASVLVFSGCTAVITDDDGETYEIPMDEAEDYAREFISEEMELYISDQINQGYSLADTLGIKQEDIEQIIREEVRNAIKEEIKNGDLVDQVFAEAGVSKEDVQTAVNAVSAFSPKTSEKKAEEKKEVKKEEPKAEVKKEEKKEEPKAEEKKEEKKEEPKAEVKKDEKKDEPKAEEKKDEKKDEPKAESTSKLDDGKPWVDYEVQDNDASKAKADPKDDFHLFVNQDWLSKTKIKEGKHSADPFSQSAEETLEKAKKLFDDKSLKSHDAELIQDYHKAVLDWDARNKEGVKPLEKTIVDLQKAEKVEDLNKIFLEDENRVFLCNPIEIGNTGSYNDSSSYVLIMQGPSLFLSDAGEYENRTEYGDRRYEATKKAVTEMLVRFGYKKDEAEKVYESALAFEKKIAKGRYTSTDRMQSDYMQKTNNEFDTAGIKKMIKNYPLFEMMDSYGFAGADKFRVPEPDNLKTIDSLYTDQNVPDIRAYVIAHLVYDGTELLDREAYELHVETDNIISGAQGSVSDEEYAFDKVRKTLTTPMDKVFIEKYDASKMKKDITGLCKEIISNYREMIKEEDWLSEETKKAAIKKLDAIQINAVYPDKWEDYSGLSLDGLSYFECSREAAAYTYMLNAKKTGKKVDKDIWIMDILEANAFYYPRDNSINIVRGILGEDFYREDMSREELLGGMGVVIGHEISHAFDTNGAQYDEKGNLNNWWTDDDLKAFQDRASKLASYYDNITVFGGNKERGENIKTEAIADMAGMKCVLDIAGSEKNTNYKELFESLAALWRRKVPYEYAYYMLTQDVHPASYLRTNVTVQQFDEFLNEYGIKKGDNMYLAPEDRVLVW
ncbi:MAG: hypothetical protein J5829_06985 [Lachnospiraceae bacterium]|nr:hypothetical protein [Lachnospiraceae bacterium]